MRDRLDTLPLDPETLAELQTRSRRQDEGRRSPLPTIPFELREAEPIALGPATERTSIPFQLTRPASADAGRRSSPVPGPSKPQTNTHRRLRYGWLVLVVALLAGAAVVVAAVRGWLPL